MRVSLQPIEFDRGTWALGTEDVQESAAIQIEEALPVDLGTIKIQCGPRAVLRMDNSAPQIDLGRGQAEVRGVLLEGFDPVTEQATRRVPLRPLSLRRTRDVIEAGGLPQGTVELTFSLCSPAAPAPAEGEEVCAPSEHERVSPRPVDRPRPGRLGGSAAPR